MTRFHPLAQNLALALVATAATLAAAPGLAQDNWPTKPVTIIVPFPPGGNADAMARIVAEKLTGALKQTVIVDNKPGAGSMIGSQYVALAAPDGYTFLSGSISNALNHYFYKKPLYDITKDLQPVSQLVALPNYLAVGPNEKIKTLPEIISYAKANPGKLSCATTGIGTSPFLSCELFKSMAGINIVNIPYKGGAPAMQDTMGGQVQMVFANEALPLIKDGRLVGVGVTTAKRTPLAPELPAISEAVPGYDLTAWYGIFAPPATPKPIVERMAKEIAIIMKDKSVQSRLASLGAVAVGSNPQEFQTFVTHEVKRWGEVIKPMNISLD